MDPLTLVPISGPSLRSLEIMPERRTTLGRSASCDVVLPDESVSRRHAAILRSGDEWLVADLGSRHGTVVNAQKLAADTPIPLSHLDLLHIGPWSFRVEFENVPSEFMPTTDDLGRQGSRVERVKAPTESLAQHRLETLIDCAALISSATNEEELAGTVLDSAMTGAGFHRAALLRLAPDGEQVDVIGYRSRTGGGTEEVSFSRSLLREASRGQMVRLTSDAMPELGVSIMHLGIASAICAPIHLGPTIDAYLYLDAREGEASVESDATGFCQVIVRLCGLALSNLKRLQLEQRQRRLETEVHAARAAQQLIVPAEHGTVGDFEYAMRMRPGSLVAGDLFDLIPLGDGRVIVCIGDVSGEGVGAGVLMAATQSHLHGALVSGAEPAHAVTIVNRYISEHSALDKFVSLWVGLFDREAGSLTFVDAGHGHWLHKPAGQPSRCVPTQGGILLGIDAAEEYTAEVIPVRPGDRVILYSDGVTEQMSPSGELFGQRRLMDVIDQSRSVTTDVESVLEAVLTYAERPNLTDDTTVAAVQVAQT